MDAEAALLQQLLQQAQQEPQQPAGNQAQTQQGTDAFSASLAALLSAQTQQQQQPAFFGGVQPGFQPAGMGGFGQQPGMAAQQFGMGVPQQQQGFMQPGLVPGLPFVQMQQPGYLPQQQPLMHAGDGSAAFLGASAAAPSSGMPPAILQHQQAALARQQQDGLNGAAGMLPGLALPGSFPAMPLPAANAGSNGVQGMFGQQQQAQQQQAQQQAQQPNWAVLQQQAAAAMGAGAPAGFSQGMPGLLPFGMAAQQQQQLLPAASSAGQQGAAAAPALGQRQAAGGGARAGAAAGGSAAGEGLPKRRGRAPADPSTLTDKQLRAREAQKRFREKQKRQMAETEEAVQTAAVELERLRVSNESQKLKHEVLERLLEYKEAQVHALEFQKQMDPPPRFTVSAEMVDMMRREGIAGLFTPEVLLRYAVAGYTDHMDERGEVREPPPFDKVAEDWRAMVDNVREILDAARQGSFAPDSMTRAASDAAAAEVQHGARMAGAAEFVELHSGSASAQSGALAGQDSLGGGGSVGAGLAARGDSAGGAAAASNGGGGSAGGGNGSEGEEVGMRQQASGQGQAAFGAAQPAGQPGQDAEMEQVGSGGGETAPGQPAAVAGAAGAAAPSSSAVGGSAGTPPAGAAGEAAGGTLGSAGSGSTSAARRQAAPLTAVPKDVLPEVAAIAEEAPEDVLEAAEAKDDPIARFVLARILSQTAAHSHLNWDTLVEGATVQHGPELYRFTGKQLRMLARLMQQVGTMIWQQALLFPEHITKLGTLRLDDPTNLRMEQQDIHHWRAILRRLHCRPEQLHKIVAGHRRYMDRMQPVLEERAEALDIVRAMTEFQTLNVFSSDTATASFVASTTRLTEATGLVMQTISAQHAAYCELLIAIFYALTFPVQRPQLFVLSWPYFPQLQLLGCAAALELGLDISDYPSQSTDAPPKEEGS